MSDRPSLGAELRAMAREAAKDIRGTVHESYFNKAEHIGEPGAPLNPTPQMVTEDLGVRGKYEDFLQERTKHAEERMQERAQGLER